MGKNPIAVLIDGENVAASHMPTIMQTARELGEPMARCVVGDFSANRLADWVALAPASAIELVFQPSGGKGRNSADIALTIRAMDLLGADTFNSFLLVSSDRDFAPLALRLRRSGIVVYGMGEAKSDSSWRAACTEFFDLGKKDAPAKPVSIANTKPTPAKKPATVAAPAFSKLDVQQLRIIIEEIPPEDGILLPHLDTRIRKAAPELAKRFCVKGKFLKNLLSVDLVEVLGEGSKKRVLLKASGQPKQSPARPTAPAPSPAAGRQPA